MAGMREHTVFAHPASGPHLVVRVLRHLSLPRQAASTPPKGIDLRCALGRSIVLNTSRNFSARSGLRQARLPQAST